MQDKILVTSLVGVKSYSINNCINGLILYKIFNKNPTYLKARPAQELDHKLIKRLLAYNKKIGGNRKLFSSKYLDQFIKLTGVLTFLFISDLTNWIIKWKRAVGAKVKTYNVGEEQIKAI